MSYHPFKSEGGEDYGSFEVFEVEAEEANEVNSPRWYWQACFPGCLPDGDPEGLTVRPGGRSHSRRKGVVVRWTG